MTLIWQWTDKPQWKLRAECWSRMFCNFSSSSDRICLISAFDVLDVELIIPDIRLALILPHCKRINTEKVRRSLRNACQQIKFLLQRILYFRLCRCCCRFLLRNKTPAGSFLVYVLHCSNYIREKLVQFHVFDIYWSHESLPVNILV